jgi:hypothetical protein
MSDPCEVVVERVALGEPLGDLAEHAQGCARCRRIAALPTELGAAHRDSDPGAGFSARMTAGAQTRIVVRKRRRIAGAVAAAVAVTTLGAFALTREPAPQKLAETPVQRDDNAPTPAAQDQDKDKDIKQDPWREPADTDEDVRALVQLADTHRSRKLSANWRRIERPLAAYRIVFKGVEK